MSKINLSQIRPSTTNGDILATVGGAIQDVTLVAGAGIFLTWSGNTLTISTTVVLVVTSFTGGTLIELGAPVSNPTFAAAYSVPPTSASIANTDGVNSPLALISPYTGVTVTGTFTHTTVTTVTFTLTAVQGGATATATQALVWQPAIFAGIGVAGASATVTASGTTAVLSTADVLARAQFGAEIVGTQFGPFTVVNQCLYLLLIGGGHTFIDKNTGAFLVFNAPIAVTFVNVHGVSVTMWLYQTTYQINGVFVPEVAS